MMMLPSDWFPADPRDTRIAELEAALEASKRDAVAAMNDTLTSCGVAMDAGIRKALRDAIKVKK
jgi:hypothetical protein